MNQEIERKFAVSYLPESVSIKKVQQLEQAFCYQDSITLVRVRKIEELSLDTLKPIETHYLHTTKIKSKEGQKIDRGNSVYEIESEIDKEQYDMLFAKKEHHCIQKTRIVIPLNTHLEAEMDLYYGALEGFLTVEVEFPGVEECKNFIKPDWFGEELRYEELSNSKLSKMTKEEFQKKVSKETLQKNKEIIQENQLLKKVTEVTKPLCY